MAMKKHTRLDLVEGGNIFKQGDYVTLGFIPRDYRGASVDLTNKQIEGSIFNGSAGVIYEGPASFVDGKIFFTIKQLLDDGKFQLEFTVTDAADQDYRTKFPTDDYASELTIKPSADNLDYFGVKMTTVSQLRKEQENKQTQFEQQIVPQVDQLKLRVENGIGAFTEDTEVLDARGDEPNLRSRLDKTTSQLNEATNKVKYLSILDFGSPSIVVDWTSAFNQAMDHAIENGIKKIVFPDGVFKGNFRVKTPNLKLEGNGWNTILTHDGNAPTLQLQSLDGTSVYDCMISDLMIKHTGTAGGLLIDGRENNFDNIRVDQCNGYGMRVLNRLDGASLNKFSNSLFFRNKGLGSVVIPPNDANGYANGNMFSNCSFDRFWSAPAVPTMDIGTSVTIVGGWTQAKNYSGIKIRGAGAYVRLVGHRIDSTDINDVLVEFIDGATLDSLQSVGSDIDGQYALNGTIKHANTMIGTLFTRAENNEIVKYFKDSQHDLTDLGGNRLSGVRIGANRIFWTGSDPVIEFPSRIHYQGDIAIRRNPTDVSTKIYICIASGTPGTWVPLLAKSAYQAGSTAADVAALRTDFNALLTKLRNAGLMANS